MASLQMSLSECREMDLSEFDHISGGQDLPPQPPSLEATLTAYPTEYTGYYDCHGEFHLQVIVDQQFDQADIYD